MPSPSCFLSLSLRHKTPPSVNTVVCQDRSALDFRCLTSELWKVWGGTVSQISNRCHQRHEIKGRTAPLGLWDRQMGVEDPRKGPGRQRGTMGYCALQVAVCHVQTAHWARRKMGDSPLQQDSFPPYLDNVPRPGGLTLSGSSP